MALTTSNYFDRVKNVDFSKLPDPLRKSHDLVKRVGTGGNAWDNYHASAQIRSMIDLYFTKMDDYLAKDGKPAKAAKKVAVTRKPKFAEGQEVLHNGKKAEITRVPFADSSDEYEYSIRYDGERTGRAGIKESVLTAVSNASQSGSKRSEKYDSSGRTQADRDRQNASEKKPTKTASIGPRKPAKAKTPRVKKARPVDIRKQVSHLSTDLVLMRSFLNLTEKPVTQTNVRNLHRKLEKAITSRKVRVSSEHAGYLRDMAELVAKTLKQMAEAKPPILSVKKLDLRPEVVANIRAVVQGTKVSSAVGLLSRFINLQGQEPEAKTVAALLKALEKEHAEHPKSDYSLAVGAAVATLRDWHKGHTVGISAQQLGRLGQLAGLGCACQDHAPAPVAGVPATKRAKAPARAALGNVDSIFTPIGEKDHRQASGKLLHLPGDLGRFLGDIEDHEYALAIRGEKGAGKTRFLYQLKNLFAGIGKRVASFSLEIGKNSDVVLRNTEAYVAANNRARVMIASEATGLDTIRQAAKAFDVVAVDSWGKIPGVVTGDFDKIRKEFPNTLFLVIFQSTTGGTSRGGSSSEYDASAVCQVNLPGVAVMEKNRYATGAADELKYLVNEQRLAQPGELS